MSKLPVWMAPALVVVMASIVIVSVKVGRRRDVQRSLALRRVAPDLGLTFVAEDNSVLRDFGGQALKPVGNSPRATSVMRGTMEGRTTALFDYDITVGTSKNRYIFRRTVAAFDSFAASLPVFELEGGRQGRFSRLFDNALRQKGIQFADDADFSRGFTVTGTDIDAIRRVLNPSVRALLLQRPHWACRSTGRWLLFSWVKERPTSAEFAKFVEQALELMRAMATVRA